jgi:hypothetical protein
MIESFPAKCCDEILHCGGSVWVGIVVKHYNTPTKDATLLILEHTAQFLKCVTIDTCIDCWVLRLEFRKQNAFFCPKTLCSWFGKFKWFVSIFLYWRWCMPPFHGPLLRFGGYVRHSCLVPSDCAAQEVIALLTVSCQKGQCTGLSFHFMFNCEHLRHPTWTQFLKTKFLRHNFMKK